MNRKDSFTQVLANEKTTREHLIALCSHLKGDFTHSTKIEAVNLVISDLAADLDNHDGYAPNIWFNVLKEVAFIVGSDDEKLMREILMIWNSSRMANTDLIQWALYKLIGAQ